MLRPIASYEVAWLVRFLVRLSQAINDSLGLTPTPQPPPEEPPETILQVRWPWLVGFVQGSRGGGMHCEGQLLLQGWDITSPCQLH